MSTSPYERNGAPRRRTARAILTAATIAGATALPHPAVASETAVPAPRIVDRVLVVDGTDGADTIAVRLAARRPDRVELDVDDDPAAEFTFTRSRFDRMAVHLGAADDAFRVDEANGVFTDTEDTTVDGGEGADRLSGGHGPETYLAGGGDDVVDGGGGNDRVSLGEANDQFLWDPGEGNDIVRGGDGFDTMVFNGSAANERFEASANGTRVRLTRNVGQVAIDLDDVERTDLAALDGRDTLDVNDLTGTDLQELRADLALTQGTGTPDAQTDFVTIVGTPGDDFIDVLDIGGTVSVLGSSAFVQLSGLAVPDALHVVGRAGDDRIGASSLRAGTVGFVATGDGGDDQLNAGAGADNLKGGPGDDFVTGNGGDDAVIMGAGNDIVRWDPGDGNDSVRGQVGRDSVSFSGSVANERFAVSPDGSGGAAITRDVDDVRMALHRIESVSVLSFGGSDTLVVDDLSGGTGIESLDASLFDFGVPGGNQDFVSLTGSENDDAIAAATVNGVATITGLPVSVRLTGTDATGDRLEVFGRSGDDTIDTTTVDPNELRVFDDGGAGDDVLLGGDGDDLLTGGAGADVVFAGSGDNVAFGGVGDDVLRGEEGDDVLDGGADDDILIGGAGDDVLLNGEVIIDD